jgi:predicted secreted protein
MPLKPRAWALGVLVLRIEVRSTVDGQDRAGDQGRTVRTEEDHVSVTSSDVPKRWSGCGASGISNACFGQVKNHGARDDVRRD